MLQRKLALFGALSLLSSFLLCSKALAAGVYVPKIAYSSQSNRYLTVYKHSDGTGIQCVYGRIFRTDGVPIGDPFAISEAGNCFFGPSVASGSNGRFLVVWDANDGYYKHIYGQLVNSDGSLHGSNFAISSANAFQCLPSVAYSPDHARFLVVWQDSRGIYGQLVDEEGTLLETSANDNFVISNANGWGSNPAVAYDHLGGRFLVVWEDGRHGSSDIYGQLVNADWGGEPPRGPLYLTASDVNFVISNAVSINKVEPSLTFDGVNNRFIVVWMDYRNGEDWDLYGQFVNGSDDGVNYFGISPDVNLPIVTTSTNQYSPDIAVDDCNGVLQIVWNDPQGGGLRGQWINLDGSVHGSDYVVSGTGYEEEPCIAANGNCGAMVAFAYQQEGTNLLGNAVLGELPDIAADLTPYDFGAVYLGNSSDEQTITLSNSGEADLKISSFGLVGQDASMFSVESGGDNPCPNLPITLPSGSSCTLVATFTPLSIGEKSSVLQVFSNDPDSEIFEVSLLGTGTDFPKVKVLTPNGNETLASGQTVTIEWEAPYRATQFKLFYSLDNGVTWKAIQKDPVPGRTYPWTVPPQNGNKKQSLVKVVGYTSKNVQVGSDRSDKPFTIEVLKLTSPNENKTLYTGEKETITWTTNSTKSDIDSVKLYYTKNSGSTWIWIKTFQGENPGSYDWTVPDVTGLKPGCKVKVVLKDKDGNTIGSDVSDVFFTIQNPN